MPNNREKNSGWVTVRVIDVEQYNEEGEKEEVDELDASDFFTVKK